MSAARMTKPKGRVTKWIDLNREVITFLGYRVAVKCRGGRLFLDLPPELAHAVGAEPACNERQTDG